MIEFYPQIKLIHVAAALLSGGLFLLRGLAVQGLGNWGMATPVRYLSYSIDIVLLTAGLTLVAVVPTSVLPALELKRTSSLSGRVLLAARDQKVRVSPSASLEVLPSSCTMSTRKPASWTRSRA